MTFLKTYFEKCEKLSFGDRRFHNRRTIEKSYSAVSINAVEFGAIVGRFEEGIIQNSFAFTGTNVYLSKNTNDILAQVPTNCRIFNNATEFTNTFNLDDEIWSISNGEMPKLNFVETSRTN